MKNTMARCLSLIALMALLAAAGTIRAQDPNATKIVGMWEVTKSASGDLPVGTVFEFTKDSKLVVKMDGVDKRLTGTYKVMKDKLTVTVKVEMTTLEETSTIKRLSDEAMELEDKDKKVETFKRKR